MNDIQILTILLSTAPIMLVVLVGILVNNSRLGDVTIRLTNIETKFDTRFDMLLTRWPMWINRLTRIEAQGR